MVNYVLDTNIITRILQEDREVMLQLQKILSNSDDDIIACPVVHYEIKRGLLAHDARKQLQNFEALYSGFWWQDYQISDWQKASELWAKRRALGLPISDADLLIAVFAINRDAVLVTNNTKDFDHLGVTLEDWAV